MSQWDHTTAPKRASLSGLTFYVSFLMKLAETKLAFTEMMAWQLFRATARKIEQIKKSICKVFSSNHLQITIEANKKVVNFLDVTLDLNKQSYAPYIKPNNKPLYVHRESNHPPLILKKHPTGHKPTSQ